MDVTCYLPAYCPGTLRLGQHLALSFSEKKRYYQVMRIKYLFILFIIWPVCSWADVEHKLLRRFAVFPIADANVSTAEDAWWQMREVLTKDQRFFVASRRFMINRGVFQARKQLAPADVIILGKILDAQALVISYLDDRIYKFIVYDTENGFVLWKSELQLHPVLQIKDQIIKIASQVMTDFITQIPYHGFQVADELAGKPVYEMDGTQRALIYVGANPRIAEGDQVQWVQVFGNPLGEILGEGSSVNVMAEGIVRSLKGDRVEVEILKAKSIEELKANSLVRFPKEVERLKEIYSLADRSSSLGSEYLSAEMKPIGDLKREHNSSSTAMTWILNLAAFVLLAF